MPHLRLPSQPQSVTAHWPVPNYIACWQGVNNLPVLSLWRKLRIRMLPGILQVWVLASSGFMEISVVCCRPTNCSWVSCQATTSLSLAWSKVRLEQWNMTYWSSGVYHFVESLTGRPNNLGQVVCTYVPLSPSSVIWYRGQAAVIPCDWEGNRRFVVVLAMRHRLQGFIHL